MSPSSTATTPSTIRDVAKAAGVSVATVSRALNDTGNVLPDTKARILQAAAALRFTPSGAARSLIMRRTETIGALLPDLYGEYFSELIRGIDQAARGRRLHLLVSSSHGDAEEAAAALRAMSGRVDGLIVMSPHADAEFLARNLPAGVPALLVNTGVGLAGHSTIAVDNFGGAKAMTQHLVARGYKRIAFVGGPAGNHEARERLRGYRAGLPKGAAAILLDGDFTEESGRTAGLAIARMKPRPQAVFAANDMMAIGCLAALGEAGLAVPRDIALAGFDDIPIARYLTPALSTVRVGIAELGRRALEGLVTSIDAAGREADVHETVPTELVVRESCGFG
jgi:LacI family transcriptional regulator